VKFLKNSPDILLEVVMNQSKNLFKISIITILFLFPLFTHSRGPAVEPILGISIDSMKKVNPVKAKGFDFSQRIIRSYKQQGLDKKKSMMLSKNYFIKKASTFNNSALLLVTIMFLPFAIWIGFLKNLKLEDEKEVDLTILMNIPDEPQPGENTISLEQFRKQKDQKKSHDESKKAS
jgi:hypothetical protein